MIEISQEFGFDAAHYLGNSAPENRRLHGHSFYVMKMGLGMIARNMITKICGPFVYGSHFPAMHCTVMDSIIMF